MPLLDRNSFIDLLERLGSGDDEDALTAARQIDQRVRQAGVSWNDLLVAPPAAAHLDTDDDEAEQPGLFTPEVVLQPVPSGEAGEDLARIERLLALSGLGEDTRRELAAFKADVAAGEFTAGDRKYLLSLEGRLSGKK